MTDIYKDALNNCMEIIAKFNSNNGGKGFDQGATWTMEAHMQVTQIMATIAVAEELRKINNTK